MAVDTHQANLAHRGGHDINHGHLRFEVIAVVSVPTGECREPIGGVAGAIQDDGTADVCHDLVDRQPQFPVWRSAKPSSRRRDRSCSRIRSAANATRPYLSTSRLNRTRDGSSECTAGKVKHIWDP